MTVAPRLVEQRWTEVRDALEAGKTTVVFAAGSTEQHGPHLPLSTDTLLGDALATAVAERLGAVCGPTVPLGVSPHHMAFPGTITLRAATFQAVIRDYAESLVEHGFETVLAIPSHGGNFAPLGELEQTLAGRLGDAQFIAYTDLEQFVACLSRIGQASNLSEGVTGSHAGEAETSLMRAIAPDLVDMNAAPEGFTEPFDAEVARSLFAHGTRALSSIGVLGDARPATAERGARYLEGLVVLLTDYFRAQLGQEQTGTP